MNIAAVEEKDEAMHCGKASEPSESVGKQVQCTLLLSRRTKRNRNCLFSSKHYNTHNPFGVAACSARFVLFFFFFLFLFFFGKSAVWIWCYFATQAGIVWKKNNSQGCLHFESLKCSRVFTNTIKRKYFCFMYISDEKNSLFVTAMHCKTQPFFK